MEGVGVIGYEDGIVGYKKDILSCLRKELARLSTDESIDYLTLGDYTELIKDIEENENNGDLVMVYDNPMCGIDWKYVTIEDVED